MSLITLTGKPGMGKTLTMVYVAYKEFCKYNSPLKVWFYEKILKKDYIYIVNQYSDFPIIFKKKRKDGKKYKYYDENNEIKESDVIGSLHFRIFDLILTNKFVDGASFYIDEIQAKYDSVDYKEFPDGIAHYCQAHRHFGNNIYCSSQSQSRIIKRILVLSEEYWNVQSFRKIFGLGIVKTRVTWDMSSNLENSFINEDFIDVDYFRRFFRIRKVANMYDSKYLRFLQLGSNLYRSKMYDSLELTPEEILYNFFPTDDEREKLKKLRY